MRFYTQQCVDAYLAAMSTNPLHAMWSSAAPSWGEHADFVDERGAVVGQAMLAAADVRPERRMCSNSGAVPAVSGSRRPRSSEPMVRWCCPTSPPK